jgi:hypothetical protein
MDFRIFSRNYNLLFVLPEDIYPEKERICSLFPAFSQRLFRNSSNRGKQFGANHPALFLSRAVPVSSVISVQRNGKEPASKFFYVLSRANQRRTYRTHVFNFNQQYVKQNSL